MRLKSFIYVQFVVYFCVCADTFSLVVVVYRTSKPCSKGETKKDKISHISKAYKCSVAGTDLLLWPVPTATARGNARRAGGAGTVQAGGIRAHPISPITKKVHFYKTNQHENTALEKAVYTSL